MSASAQLSAYRAARASELARAEIERHAALLPPGVARRVMSLATIARDEANALCTPHQRTAATNVIPFPRRAGA